MLEAAEKARESEESHASKFADALERIARVQSEDSAEMKIQRENSDRSMAEAENHIQKLQAELATEQSEHLRQLEIAQTRVYEQEVALARTETKLETTVAGRSNSRET